MDIDLRSPRYKFNWINKIELGPQVVMNNAWGGKPVYPSKSLSEGAISELLTFIENETDIWEWYPLGPYHAMDGYLNADLVDIKPGATKYEGQLVEATRQQKNNCKFFITGFKLYDLQNTYQLYKFNLTGQGLQLADKVEFGKSRPPKK